MHCCGDLLHDIPANISLLLVLLPSSLLALRMKYSSIRAKIDSIFNRNTP